MDSDSTEYSLSTDSPQDIRKPQNEHRDNQLKQILLDKHRTSELFVVRHRRKSKPPDNTSVKLSENNIATHKTSNQTTLRKEISPCDLIHYEDEENDDDEDSESDGSYFAEERVVEQDSSSSGYEDDSTGKPDLTEQQSKTRRGFPKKESLKKEALKIKIAPRPVQPAVRQTQGQNTKNGPVKIDQSKRKSTYDKKNMGLKQEQPDKKESQDKINDKNKSGKNPKNQPKIETKPIYTGPTKNPDLQKRNTGNRFTLNKEKKHESNLKLRQKRMPDIKPTVASIHIEKDVEVFKKRKSILQKNVESTDTKEQPGKKESYVLIKTDLSLEESEPTPSIKSFDSEDDCNVGFCLTSCEFASCCSRPLKKDESSDIKCCEEKTKDNEKKKSQKKTKKESKNDEDNIQKLQRTDSKSSNNSGKEIVSREPSKGQKQESADSKHSRTSGKRIDSRELSNSQKQERTDSKVSRTSSNQIDSREPSSQSKCRKNSKQDMSQSKLDKSVKMKPGRTKCIAEVGGYTIKFGIKGCQNTKNDEEQQTTDEKDSSAEDDKQKSDINNNSACAIKLCGFKGCGNIFNRKLKTDEKKENETKQDNEDENDNKKDEGRKDNKKDESGKEKEKGDDENLAIAINVPIGQIYKLKSPNVFSVIIQNSRENFIKPSKVFTQKHQNNSENREKLTNKKNSDTSIENLPTRGGSRFQKIIHMPRNTRQNQKQARDRQIQMYNQFLKSMIRKDSDTSTNLQSKSHSEEEEVEEDTIKQTNRYLDDTDKDLSSEEYSSMSGPEDSEQYIKPNFLEPANLFNEDTMKFNKSALYKLEKQRKKEQSMPDICFELYSNKFQSWGLANPGTDVLDSDAENKEQCNNKTRAEKNEHFYDRDIIEKSINESKQRGQLYKRKSKTSGNKLFLPKRKRKKQNLNSSFKYRDQSDKKQLILDVEGNDTTDADLSESSGCYQDGPHSSEVLFSTDNENIIANLGVDKHRNASSPSVIVFSQLCYKPSQNDMCFNNLRYHETKILETTTVSVSKKKKRKGIFEWLKKKLFH